MTLKKVIQDIKITHRLTYLEMAEITGVPKLTLQNYGCARNKTIGYINAKKIYETLDVDWDKLQLYIR